MLFYTLSDGTEGGWHTGTSLRLTDEQAGKVIVLQADGDELVHIQRMCPHLVPAGKLVVRVFGCIAQTIAANL